MIGLAQSQDAWLPYFHQLHLAGVLPGGCIAAWLARPAALLSRGCLQAAVAQTRAWPNVLPCLHLHLPQPSVSRRRAMWLPPSPSHASFPTFRSRAVAQVGRGSAQQAACFHRCCCRAAAAAGAWGLLCLASAYSGARGALHGGCMQQVLVAAARACCLAEVLAQPACSGPCPGLSSCPSLTSALLPVCSQRGHL